MNRFALTITLCALAFACSDDTQSPSSNADASITDAGRRQPIADEPCDIDPAIVHGECRSNEDCAQPGTHCIELDGVDPKYERGKQYCLENGRSAAAGIHCPPHYRCINQHSDPLRLGCHFLEECGDPAIAEELGCLPQSPD